MEQAGLHHATSLSWHIYIQVTHPDLPPIMVPPRMSVCSDPVCHRGALRPGLRSRGPGQTPGGGLGAAQRSVWLPIWRALRSHHTVPRSMPVPTENSFLGDGIRRKYRGQSHDPSERWEETRDRFRARPLPTSQRT